MFYKMASDAEKERRREQRELEKERKEDLYKGKKIYKIEDYDLKLFNELIFEPTYFDWLVNKGWKNEEEGHYTKGIQEELAQEYIKRINQFRIKKII
jgi:hypothetical protein